MEESLDSKYRKKKAWFTAINAVLGNFIFSYNMGVFTSCQPAVASSLGWGSDTNTYIAVMSSLVSFGALFGALFAGLSARYIGRRQNMIVADFVIIAAALITVIPFTPTFGIGRFLSGFGIGNFSVLCPLYVNEISPVEISGRLGSLMQLFGCIGLLFAYGFALALPTGQYEGNPRTHIWILMFLFQGVVAIMQLLLFKFYFTKETAPWLMNKGYEAKALDSLKFIYNDSSAEEMMKKFNKSTTSLSRPDEVAKYDFSYREIFTCTSATKKAMRLGLLISIFQQFTGINAILSYATTIFGEFGSGVFIARLLTLVSGIVKFFATFGLMPLIDRFGRKITLIMGCIAMGISLGIMGFFSLYSVIFIVPFLFIELYLSFFVMSIGPICWIYSGEILSSRGMSICTAVNWFTAFLVVLFFPFMVAGLGLSITFWIFAMINVLGGVYFWLDMIETKGMNKTDIQALLASQR